MWRRGGRRCCGSIGRTGMMVSWRSRQQVGCRPTSCNRCGGDYFDLFWDGIVLVPRIIH